jgi:RNA polymerase sigma-70 factor, ECF subfamily
VLFENYRRAPKEISSGDGINVPDPAIGVADAIANRQMQQGVHHILTKLSERDRRLLAAPFLDERDKDEVCQSFGVSREYLRVLLWRAKNFRVLSLQENEDPLCRASFDKGNLTKVA